MREIKKKNNIKEIKKRKIKIVLKLINYFYLLLHTHFLYFNL